MKFLKVKLSLVGIFLLNASPVICTNLLHILNKVKPQEGESIYVEIKYRTLGIWHTKSRKLRYNESLNFYSLGPVSSIRIRNTKKESEVIMGPREGSGKTRTRIERRIKSRIASITGDVRIFNKCNDFVRKKLSLVKLRKKLSLGKRIGKYEKIFLKTCYCNFYKLNKYGGLKNKEIVFNLFSAKHGNFLLVVTRKPGTFDFIVTEVSPSPHSFGPYAPRFSASFYSPLKKIDLGPNKK